MKSDDKKQIVASGKQLVSKAGHLFCQDDEYWRLILKFRQSEMEAINRWLDLCLETIHN